MARFAVDATAMREVLTYLKENGFHCGTPDLMLERGDALRWPMLELPLERDEYMYQRYFFLDQSAYNSVSYEERIAKDNNKYVGLVERMIFDRAPHIHLSVGINDGGTSYNVSDSRNKYIYNKDWICIGVDERILDHHKEVRRILRAGARRLSNPKTAR